MKTACLPLALLVAAVGCWSGETETDSPAPPSAEVQADSSSEDKPERKIQNTRPGQAEDERPGVVVGEEPDRAAAEKQEEGRDEGDDNASKSAEEPPLVPLDELPLFYPSKYPAGQWQPAGLEFEDVWFEASDKTRIHGWFCPCDEARAVVLYAHGNAGHLADRAPLLARLQRLRCAVLIFDYRGYGRSAGVPTVAGILNDARAARQFLTRHAGVDGADVVLMGRSLGGAVAVQLAAEQPARGLVLESTFSSLREAATALYPRMAWLVPADKLNSAAIIGRHRGPLLQSHGDADRTVPYELGLKLFRAANEPKQLIRIPSGRHNQLQPDGYYEQLDRFLDGLPKRE